ncbi:MAG TPA: N-acetyltransferase [Flavobacteriaceae bacterium]|nr:N-acetyltransferase [Flavobacteriaceae bacterium]
MDLVEITDNEFLRQFELNIEGQLARIEYSLQERKIFLTKFDMSDELIADGYKEPFIEAVFNEVRERGISLVPTSPEIAGFMRANRRKYKELLPVGINL